MPPSPDELKARAAAIREELKELEADVSATRRPNADLVEPKRVRGAARKRHLLQTAVLVFANVRDVLPTSAPGRTLYYFICFYYSDLSAASLYEYEYRYTGMYSYEYNA